MQRWFLLLSSLAGVALAAAPARADSLWQRRKPHSAFLFVDTRARLPGDLLTIVVRETTDIDYKDRRDLDKQTRMGGLFGLKGSTTGNLGGRSVGADLDASGSSNRKLEGKAEYTSDRRLLDRMTVTVVEVLPNGNLVIDGWRRRVVGGEERLMQVTGTVRPIDIGSGNVVESQYIANFQVIYHGKGPDSKFTNHGWFNQIADYFWPY